MKTIAIIGGMGPQASLFAQNQLIKELDDNGIRANTVHITLDINHFFDSSPKLRLTDSQKELLRSIKADVGIIACNTAHIFFDEFQELVSFELINLTNIEIDKNEVVLCSPTSKKFKVFGDVNYFPDSLEPKVTKLVQSVIADNNSVGLVDIVREISSNGSMPIIACTELSLLANEEGLSAKNTLEISIDKVMEEIKHG